MPAYKSFPFAHCKAYLFITNFFFFLIDVPIFWYTLSNYECKGKRKTFLPQKEAIDDG